MDDRNFYELTQRRASDISALVERIHKRTDLSHAQIFARVLHLYRITAEFYDYIEWYENETRKDWLREQALRQQEREMASWAASQYPDLFEYDPIGAIWLSS